MQQIILELLSSQPAFQKLADEIRSGNTQDQLGLARATRIPFLAAVQAELDRPLLLITDKIDRALVLEDEWDFWFQDQPLHVSLNPIRCFMKK